MVDRGATTVWEEWGGVDADGVPHASLNHYSKGAVITFLHQYVAGLQIVEPGYRRFRVAPQPGRRTHVGRGRAREPVRDDRGAVGTRRRPASRSTSPCRPGTTAEVVLPDGAATTLTSGRHTVGP